jgi:hypothetical protein
MALALLAAGGGVARAQQAVSVILDPSTRYQTILGWGKTTPWLPAPQLLRDQCIDRTVNDLGINRLRFEGLCGNSTRRRSWEWLNDNADPYVIDWGGFNTAAVDAVADEWLKPWKRAVEARGEKLNLYVSPSFFQGGSSGDLPPWMRANPQECAEWAVALLTRLRDAHGITADYYCICNEAGNNNAFDPPRVARAISALMPRLRQLGFPTTVQFPESVNAQVAWRYVEALRDDPEVWKWIGLISYHWYGQDNQSAMAKLRDFAFRAGLPTAQTEFMDLTIDHLYDDMVIGGVSYWEIYGLASPDYKAALSHVSSKTFHAGPWYWRFRQVSHYVRPGAVRIGCASSDPALRCLAFEHGGQVTVVLINTTPPHAKRAVVLRGLPAGTYGVSQCVGQDPYKELGLRTVAGDGLLSVEVAANSVLTVYPHGPGNGPPTVVEWRSAPDFLSAPASSVQLSCLATDPEADGLSYKWSVVGQPPGAQVALSTPSGASVRAAGLTQPGDYLFAAEVSDGTHAVARQVLVRAFAGNQAPVPTDVHNRIPVWVTVKDAGTLLRAAAWDVEGDPVTFRWEVLAAPPGASPTLETPDKPACRAAGMTVPGDYVFRVCLSDPTHTVCTDHTVPVYP